MRGFAQPSRRAGPQGSKTDCLGDLKHNSVLETHITISRNTSIRSRIAQPDRRSAGVGVPTLFEPIAVRGRHGSRARRSTGAGLAAVADEPNPREDLDMWIEDVADFALAYDVGDRIVREIKARERAARQAIQRMRGDTRL